MPVAGHATYCEMLDRARKGKFAYPAINVTSLTTANAVLKVRRRAGATELSRYRRAVPLSR
jgi:fructose-bisphosphate aldolase class II